MDTKATLLKLLKIAQKQQKVLEKLAQSSGIWYGKLDPNDPRRFDPMYGGEAPPEGEKKEEKAKSAPAPAPKPVQKPTTPPVKK